MDMYLIFLVIYNICFATEIVPAFTTGNYLRLAPVSYKHAPFSIYLCFFIFWYHRIPWALLSFSPSQLWDQLLLQITLVLFTGE